MRFRHPSPPPDPAHCLPGRPDPIVAPGAHFVTGVQLDSPVPRGHEELIIGMGCFWGAERLYWDVPGVFVTAVGYSGGTTPNPTYEETCTSMTGHTEAVRIVFDPQVVSVDELLKIFWENHDPTQYMGQGNDIGSQYRSAIYTSSADMLETAKRSRDAYQHALTVGGYGEITTEIAPAGVFYYAEDYHQQYLAKNPGGYCNHGFCQVEYATA